MAMLTQTLSRYMNFFFRSLEVKEVPLYFLHSLSFTTLPFSGSLLSITTYQVSVIFSHTSRTSTSHMVLGPAMTHPSPPIHVTYKRRKKGKKGLEENDDKAENTGGENVAELGTIPGSASWGMCQIVLEKYLRHLLVGVIWSLLLCRSECCFNK